MTNLTIKKRGTQLRKTIKNHKKMTSVEKSNLAIQMHPGLTLETAISDFKSLQKTNCDNIKDVKMTIRKGSNFVDYFTICAQTRSLIFLVNASGKGTYSSSNSIFFPFLK